MDEAEVRVGVEGCQLIFEGPPFAEHVGVRLECGAFLRVGDSVVLDMSLPSFFDRISESWRGWSGPRTWESAGGGLALSARHDGVGHVFITATLVDLGIEQGQDPRSVGDWMAVGVVRIEPSQSASIAQRLQRLLSQDHSR